eukprot:10232095-Alexandrium_andersonii.AAC.1
MRPVCELSLQDQPSIVPHAQAAHSRTVMGCEARSTFPWDAAVRPAAHALPRPCIALHSPAMAPQ